VARALLEALREPIAAPSANRYQSISPTTAAHVAASLGDRVDLILDGGPCSAGIESTVVDVRGAHPVILRPGAIDLPTLAAVVPGVVEATEVPDESASRASPGMDRRHYAPRTPLVLAASRAGALDEAGARASKGERVGLLLVLPPEKPLPSGVVGRSLGGDSRGYARALFATLHELDTQGLGVILVEPVPAEPSWRAIADRLRRASEAASPAGPVY
jgi:L-threonylcarbamoyladenylate synthase